jgi:hypothetical protein
MTLEARSPAGSSVTGATGRGEPHNQVVSGKQLQIGAPKQIVRQKRYENRGESPRCLILLIENEPRQRRGHGRAERHG